MLTPLQRHSHIFWHNTLTPTMLTIIGVTSGKYICLYCPLILPATLAHVITLFALLLHIQCCILIINTLGLN
jgi:hypothetical protein